MALINDPVEDLKGLLPPAPVDPLIKVSEDDIIGQEPTSKTIRLENEANTVVDGNAFVPDGVELFVDSVGKAFTSGDNWAYQVWKRQEREALSPPPDPTFKSEDFVTRNREVIPQAFETQFHMATSEREASLILADMNDELRKKEILERRGGFSTFVAQGIAGIVDLDAPLSLLSGGAAAGFKGGIMATKWGKLMGTAASGGAVQASAAAIALEAGTTGDWTSIPAAGLGGMVFGVAGGALGKQRTEIKANDTVQRVVKDFDEYVADGAPLSKHDIRAETHVNDDAYGSHAEATRKLDLQNEPKDMRGDFDDEEIIIIEAPAKADGSAGVPTVVRLDEINPQASPTVVPTGSTMKDVQGESGGSMGARQLATQGSVATVASPRVTAMIISARNWANRTGIVQEYNDKYVGLVNRANANAQTATDNVAKWASRVHDALAASPLATDFDRIWRSGSIVGQRVAYDLFESASGIVRNNRSAANIMEMYRNQLGVVSEHYSNTRKLWNKEQGISVLEALSPEHRQKFNQEILTELQARAYGRGQSADPSPSVKLAADAIDDFHAKDVEIGKGRPGEGAIKGYENFQHYSGYFQQKWNGASMQKMIYAGKSEKDIIDALSEMYVKMHAGMKKTDADIYAGAVVQRALRGEQGMDVNLISVFQQNGKEFLADTLRRNGVSASDADKLIDKLTGEAAVRGQQGHTKSRIDIDMRFTASNGISMMDLVDNDVAGILARRVRSTAGAAALARKGITSKEDIAAIKEAILSEQRARGPNVQSTGSVYDKFNDLVDKDRHLTGDDIDDLFSNFTGGPIGKGLSPFYASVKKITNLALLPQLGLTQLGELGAQISSVGLKRWFEHAGGAMRGNAINPQSELSKELRHMGVMVPEDRYFRNDMNLDMDRQGPASSWFAQKMQSTLNSAQHLQGYTSLFYQVRNFQQRVAVTSAADKIMQNMGGLRNDFTAERAADIGLSPALYARIQRKYVQPVNVNQHSTRPPIVEFRDGSLYKANFDKWEPQDAEDFTLALNRHVNQVVQKAMVGESSILFHRDGLASLFFHMKTFSLLAIEKQALRNLKHQDGEAAGTFLAGLATAAAAYSVKQAINGNTQNLNIDKIARGAIGYSNMTGWLPMWADPVTGMLGLDALKIGAYGRAGSGPISSPAALSAMNGLLQIPAIPGHALTGNLSNNDVRALQTTPIIGKAYGMNYLLNQLKTD